MASIAGAPTFLTAAKPDLMVFSDTVNLAWLWFTLATGCSSFCNTVYIATFPLLPMTLVIRAAIKERYNGISTMPSGMQSGHKQQHEIY